MYLYARVAVEGTVRSAWAEGVRCVAGTSGARDVIFSVDSSRKRGHWHKSQLLWSYGGVMEEENYDFMLIIKS